MSDTDSSRQVVRRPTPSRAAPRIRRLRLDVELEFDDRVPLPDSYIVTAIADALPEMNAQGLLFPGVDWPAPLERLRDWSVRLTGAGRRVSMATPVEVAVEHRRREGDLGLRPAPTTPAEAKLRAEADALLAAIDDLEPVAMERAKAAWHRVVRLRHMAARLDVPAGSVTELRAAIDEARELLASAG